MANLAFLQLPSISPKMNKIIQKFRLVICKCCD
uniref:Uncharacterized protein n=1 Tax=Arundo donax TaxID=35708 RepID=A0A0A9ALH8_ARUDO